MSFNHRIGSFGRIPSPMEALDGVEFDPYAPGNAHLNRRLHPRKAPPPPAIVTFTPEAIDAMKAEGREPKGDYRIGQIGSQAAVEVAPVIPKQVPEIGGAAVAFS